MKVGIGGEGLSPGDGVNGGDIWPKELLPFEGLKMAEGSEDKLISV